MFFLGLCVDLKPGTSLSMVGTDRRSASLKISFRFYDVMNCLHAYFVLCVSVNDGQYLQTFSGHV